ncbi:hypothetical protein OPV22_017504 [Ensete ventricosum]|uniref:C2H2-type domain-containing protein n=1 Tax=Ensete ventricosum TaxID=4639 RepID=A0AAV8QTX2_ENSVE|nr:hypothetical protein OPV22_017500 [Ensete ventricosum]KAJ8485019.1 hypothetical protein OPV22_017504 [Ensete ventricosum]RWV77809.1 hypothetical protein GW17_00061322 [Ensete ventricosum]RWW56994.1 hypothetical protein BHE74_00036252 [Ensete ventricosum]RZR99060.1 hypothetical protein BHM03_00028535 [Ensete ventricosum]
MSLVSPSPPPDSWQRLLGHLVRDKASFRSIQPTPSCPLSHSRCCFLMDPNFFSSHSSSPLVVSDDSLLSPLYEVMFPFSAPTTPSAIPCNPRTAVSAFGELSTRIPDGSFTSFVTSHHYKGFPSTACQKPDQDNASPMAFPPFPVSCLHLPSSTMPNFYDPIKGGFELEFGLQSSSSRPFTPYLDPNPLNLPDSTSEHAKSKYSCEACQVGFGTSQALGGHMSSHSRERKGTTVATAKPNAPSSASKSSNKKKKMMMMMKKKKNSLTPISKKIYKAKVAVKRVPEMSSTIRLVAKKNSSPELPIESRSVGETATVEQERLRNSATRVVAAINPPEEIDSLSYMIDAIWLSDVCDMDFSSLFDS